MSKEIESVEDKGFDIKVVRERTNAQAPEEFTGIKIKEPKKDSAGISGVITALSHVQKSLDLSTAVKTMFKVNQKGGFDCPGCAWPDPDDERSALGEYCENGIKAISEEATKRRLEPDFFRQHSVEEMAGWSDY